MFFRLNFTKGLSMVRKKTNEIEKPINAFSEEDLMLEDSTNQN